MRKLDVYLAGEYITAAFCDEQCDRCRWRFACYTTKGCTLKVTMNSEELHQHYIVDELWQRDQSQFMRCPHCGEIFKLKWQQVARNERFKCKACGKYNYGSHTADDFGVLIGCPYESVTLK